MELKEGEKYLSISMFGGQKSGGITVAVFPNKMKVKPQDPDYTGNGLAVWIREKKAVAPQTIAKTI